MAGNKKGQTLTLTPEKFSEGIDRFIEYCDEHPEIEPTDYQLAKFLNIAVTTLWRYNGRNEEIDNLYDTVDLERTKTPESKKKSKKNAGDSNTENIDNNIYNNNNTGNNTSNERYIIKPYLIAYKKIIAYREDRLFQRMANNPKAATPCIFALKQRANGGWTDKQVNESTGKMEVSVSISGINDAAFD